MLQIPTPFLPGNVGSGHSRANDVVRIRKALHETGYGRSPQTPSPVYDSSIRSNIVGFQEDFGLKPDGFLAPGGPTELNGISMEYLFRMSRRCLLILYGISSNLNRILIGSP